MAVLRESLVLIRFGYIKWINRLRGPLQANDPITDWPTH